MKRHRIAMALCLLFAFSAPALSQEAVVKIADVYPRGARVTLEAQSQPDMTFDFPLSFEEESIRVTGAGTRILSVETSRIQRTGWVPPALAGLDARVKKARAEVDRLESRLASLQQTAKHLQDPVPSSWRPQDLAAFLETAEKRREQVEQKTRENQRALEKARAELSRLENELTGKMPPEHEAANRVRIKTSGSGTVRLPSGLRKPPGTRPTPSTWQAGRARWPSARKPVSSSGRDWTGTERWSCTRSSRGAP